MNDFIDLNAKQLRSGDVTTLGFAGNLKNEDRNKYISCFILIIILTIFLSPEPTLYKNQQETQQQHRCGYMIVIIQSNHRGSYV